MGAGPLLGSTLSNSSAHNSHLDASSGGSRKSKAPGDTPAQAIPPSARPPGLEGGAAEQGQPAHALRVNVTQQVIQRLEQGGHMLVAARLLMGAGTQGLV